MTAHLRVPGGVAVGRAVAAQRRAAFLAGPQMDPVRADFHTLVALMALLVFDGLDGAEVGTAWSRCHCLSLVSIDAYQWVNDVLVQAMNSGSQ
jgi:hypothetical protein